MKNKVYLNIRTVKGLISIPFVGLRELDYFTVGYENEENLIESLNKILDLSLSVTDVNNIYISGNRYKDAENSSLSCIKYSRDNYNLDSLVEMLALYLKKNRERIRNCDVRHVATEGMTNFNAGMSISDSDIDLAVKTFLKSGYKKQRDMYFMVKNFSSVKIDGLPNEDIERTKLSKMEAKDDESYVQYLFEFVSKGEEEEERAMDELSKVDFEDISEVLGNNRSTLFDGVTDEKIDSLEDIYALEVLTELSIDKIKELQTEYRGYSGRRK